MVEPTRRRGADEIFVGREPTDRQQTLIRSRSAASSNDAVPIQRKLGRF